VRVTIEEIKKRYYIESLSNEELMLLTAQEAQQRMQENMELLAKLNNDMMIATDELGKARIKVEMLKNTKNTLIEMNRALKEIIRGEKGW
jgi:hypothetical protein